MTKKTSHKKLVHTLADDTSLTSAEKLQLARTLSAPLPRKPKTIKQAPDWLASKFEQHEAQQHQQAYRQLGRTYLLAGLGMVGGFFLLTMVVIIVLWLVA
jgi:hypothetical protein